MRCNNCGWDNANENLKCTKCNYVFSAKKQDKTPIVDNSKENLNSTILDNDSTPGKTISSINTSTEAIENRCESCGYPVLVGADICPECNKKVIKTSNSKIETIDPWASNKEASFSLKPISRDNESKLPDLIFKGDSIILNRDNLEKENSSITSKAQAEIKVVDGKFYLANMSDKLTTFIQVNDDIELKKGAVILMGDRKFIFDF